MKGGDYTVATIVGADFVQTYVGKVVLIPLESGPNTTSVVARANVGSE
jgi:D-beta-D-heptose 7-phosphate kinase / D-beta-D-heptose 1-phosphate adenosyltransferase